MPAAYREEDGCGVLELGGTYTVVEARDALMGGLGDASREQRIGLIVDISESEMVVGRTSAEIMRAAQALGVIGDRFSQRLAVVASTAVAFGLMRMGGVHAENVGLTVHVFRDFHSALEWVLQGGQGGR